MLMMLLPTCHFTGFVFICVSIKGLKYAFKQYREEDCNNWQISWDKDNKSYWAAFRTDGKIERFLEKSGHAVCFRSRI